MVKEKASIPLYATMARVVYAGRELYFEPNGKRCYLYTKKAHLGKPELAVFAPAISSLGGCKRDVRNAPLVPLPRTAGSVQDEIARIDATLERLSKDSDSFTMGGGMCTDNTPMVKET
jgi:hypothetical protein